MKSRQLKDLSRYHDGLGNDEFRTKMEQNIAESKEMQRELEIYNLVRDAMPHTDCEPSSQCLTPGDFLLLGQSPSDSPHIQELRNHILECSPCREDFFALKATQDVEQEVSEEDLIQPSSSLLDRMRDLAPEVEAAPRRRTTTINRRKTKFHTFKRRRSSNVMPWVVSTAAALLLVAFLLVLPDQNRRHQGTTAKNDNSTTRGKQLPPVKPDKLAKAQPNRDGSSTSSPDNSSSSSQNDNSTNQPENSTNHSSNSTKDKSPRHPPKVDKVDPSVEPQTKPEKRDPKKSKPSHTKTVERPDPTKKPEKKQPRPKVGRLMVKRLKGQIYIKSGTSLFKQLKQGAVLLSENEEVRIGKGGAWLGLSQGDTVYLQGGARLAFASKMEQKMVQLHRGTALFSFQDDTPTQGARIKTNEAILTSSNSEFLVQARSSTTYVTVMSGSVTCESVKYPGQKMVMGPSDHGTFSSSRKPTVRALKGDLSKLTDWTRVFLPRKVIAHNFEQGNLNGWVGDLVQKNTFVKSNYSLRSRPFQDKYFGVKVSLPMYTFTAEGNLILRFAYFVSRPTSLYIHVYNETQKKHYKFRLTFAKTRVWTEIGIPLSEMRAYNGSKRDRIKAGDSLRNVEILAGTPKNAKEIHLLIDNFSIVRGHR